MVGVMHRANDLISGFVFQLPDMSCGGFKIRHGFQEFCNAFETATMTFPF